MVNLSTDDLRFLASKVLNSIDFDYEKYNLDENYITDLRESLLTMADDLDNTGEVEIKIRDDNTKDKKDESKDEPKRKKNSPFNEKSRGSDK